MNGGIKQKSVNELLAAQLQFYTDLSEMDCDFSNVVIPERPEGFNRLLIVPNGMTAQRAYDHCSQHFKCWKYTDRSLDDAVATNERDAKDGLYAIWVRDAVEADEQHKNKSADLIRCEKLATETLTERLLHELIYFKETGNHLDIENVTLCAGSSDSVGDVPGVGWRGGKLTVGWCFPYCADFDLRAREVAF
jgi:hypothetical protein